MRTPKPRYFLVALVILSGLLIAACLPTEPAVSLNPSSLTFTKASPQEVEIHNISIGSFTVTSISTPAAPFVVEDPKPCKGKEVSAGGGCKFKVTMSKFESGKSSSITVITTAGSAPVSLKS
jgi:hypothetical protein